jgi:hypothetical protein
MMMIERVDKDHLCAFRDELALALGREKRLRDENKLLQAEVDRLTKLPNHGDRS